MLELPALSAEISADMLTEILTVYDFMRSDPAWLRAALVVPAMFAYAMLTQIAQQFHYYADPGQRWSLWSGLEGGPTGKHPLDFIEDPVPHVFAVVAGIDLFIYAGLAMMLTQLVQWRGVNEGTGHAADPDFQEGASYDLFGREIPKVHGFWRELVFVCGGAILVARALLLML